MPDPIEKYNVKFNLADFIFTHECYAIDRLGINKGCL